MLEATPREALIALNAHPTLPRAAVCRLAQDLDRLLTPGQAEPGSEPLEVSPRHLAKARSALGQAHTLAAAEEAAARSAGIHILTRVDAGYPPSLADAPLPPPVLYCRGELPGGSAVAIVGSRRATPYALEAAHFFGRQLALRGVTVVSGYAAGVDLAAHRGALAAEAGQTVAVLGCGLDIDYPRGRRELSSHLAGRGALISELPLGTLPRPQNFPIRNRIIAALASSTLVIQATPRSGSLITARYALEMGRDLFALPGRIFDEGALGPNALLRDGAGIALHPDDLLPELASAPQRAEAEPPLAPGLMAVWKALPPGSTLSPEIVAERADRPLGRVLAALLELELGGWVHRYPGPRYARRTR